MINNSFFDKFFFMFHITINMFREPLEYAGVSSGINLANAQEQGDVARAGAISDLDNNNIAIYRDQVQGRENKITQDLKDSVSDIREKQKEATQKVAEYGGAVGEKVGEYRNFINSGGDVSKLRSVRFANNVGGRLGKAGSGVYNTVKSSVTSAPAPTGSVGNPEGVEMTDFSADAPNQRQSTGGESEQPESNQVGSSEGESTVEASSNSGGEVANDVKVGESAGEEAGSLGEKAGKIVGKVGKVGGALFSAGMLGSDIYEQSKHGFFYGDNTGDKVGNFMNELGSSADLLGVATGDPLLAVAGVGLGVVGSVVSDISELFGHHKKQAPPPPPPPPPKPTIIAQPVQQNVGGSGGLVEASSSTLT